MSISFRILGKAGGDNALLVQLDSGQAIQRLLFDCGEGCLSELALAAILALGLIKSVKHCWHFDR
jgi:ribonuclease Z